MKIKISKNQWEEIGKKTGWMNKEAWVLNIRDYSFKTKINHGPFGCCVQITIVNEAKGAQSPQNNVERGMINKIRNLLKNKLGYQVGKDLNVCFQFEGTEPLSDEEADRIEMTNSNILFTPKEQQKANLLVKNIGDILTGMGMRNA